MRTVGLVVEDQTDARVWLAQVLKDVFPEIEVVTLEDLRSSQAWLKAWAASDQPASVQVALVDLGLPDGSGVTFLRELTDKSPDTLPIVTTIYDDDVHLFDAIAAGARGYLLKDHAPETLVSYLRRIKLGEPPLSPSIARRMLDYFRSQGTQLAAYASEPEISLTPRETDVLGLLGRGLRVGEGARVLGLSEHTVADHVKSIYRKLNISSRAEAALEAARRGLV